MPDLERFTRSLHLHMHKDDPVEQAKIKHGHEQRDKGRLEGLLWSSLVWGSAVFAYLMKAWGVVP